MSYIMPSALNLPQLAMIGWYVICWNTYKLPCPRKKLPRLIPSVAWIIFFSYFAESLYLTLFFVRGWPLVQEQIRVTLLASMSWIAPCLLLTMMFLPRRASPGFIGLQLQLLLCSNDRNIGWWQVTLELKHTFTTEPQVETITFQHTATGGIKGIFSDSCN